jgi:hypothetical protein
VRRRPARRLLLLRRGQLARQHIGDVLQHGGGRRYGVLCWRNYPAGDQLGVEGGRCATLMSALGGRTNSGGHAVGTDAIQL